MRKLQEALTLFNDAKNCRTHIERYKENTKPSNVDKHANKFVIGNSDRFVSQKLHMYLECYRGYYGNSSCSTISLGSNHDAISRAYVSWANKNMQLILDGIAEELEFEAISLKDEVKQELDHSLNAYNAAFGDNDHAMEQGE